MTAKTKTKKRRRTKFTVRDLIESLENVPPDTEVMLFSGSGLFDRVTSARHLRTKLALFDVHQTTQRGVFTLQDLSFLDHVGKPRRILGIG